MSNLELVRKLEEVVKRIEECAQTVETSAFDQLKQLETDIEASGQAAEYARQKDKVHQGVRKLCPICESKTEGCGSKRFE
jgi:hypothetical protein